MMYFFDLLAMESWNDLYCSFKVIRKQKSYGSKIDNFVINVAGYKVVKLWLIFLLYA